MKFIDRTTVAGQPRLTTDGYLAGMALVAKAGIQVYAGDEVGKPEMDMVRVYRPPEEVFSDASMASFAGKPICVGHPDEIVNADNWKDYAVGTIGSDIEQTEDRKSLQVSFALMDAAAIKGVQSASGDKELSVGYRSTLDWTPGTTKDGQAYDAIQRNIFVDHLAIVKHGRANEGDPSRKHRISDAVWGAAPLSDQSPANHPKKEAPMTEFNQTVVIGDEAVTTDAAGKAAIEKVKADMAAMEEKHKADMEAKQKELDDMTSSKDEADGKLKAAEAKLADAADPKRMADAVAARSLLVDQCKALGLSGDLATLSDADLRKKAVAVKLGDEAVKDASDDMITGMFKGVAADIKTETRDGVVKVMGAGIYSNDAAPSQNQAFRDKVFAIGGVKMKKGA